MGRFCIESAFTLGTLLSARVHWVQFSEHAHTGYSSLISPVTVTNQAPSFSFSPCLVHPWTLRCLRHSGPPAVSELCRLGLGPQSRNWVTAKQAELDLCLCLKTQGSQRLGFQVWNLEKSPTPPCCPCEPLALSVVPGKEKIIHPQGAVRLACFSPAGPNQGGGQSQSLK